MSMHVTTSTVATIIIITVSLLNSKEFSKVTRPKKCALGATTGSTDLGARSPRFQFEHIV